MDLIRKAINEYHTKTCIRFIPKRPSDKDFLVIQDSDSGCWSSVGRTGGRQVSFIDISKLANLSILLRSGIEHSESGLYRKGRNHYARDHAYRGIRPWAKSQRTRWFYWHCRCKHTRRNGIKLHKSTRLFDQWLRSAIRLSEHDALLEHGILIEWQTNNSYGIY